jgi:hypothetical protein
MPKLVLSVFTAVIIAVTVTASQAPQIPPADLVLRGGRIVTLDATTP